MNIPGIDAAVLHYLSGIRSIGGSYFFVGVSELVSPYTTLGLSACIVLALALRRKAWTIAGFLLALGGSNAAWYAIKAITERPRPPLAYAAFIEDGSSFPSGHATNIAALCTFFLLFAWPFIPRGLPRIAAAALALSLVALIAFARLYLGLHYLSDVVAGAALGAIFGLAGAWLARRTTPEGLARREPRT